MVVATVRAAGHVRAERGFEFAQRTARTGLETTGLTGGGPPPSATRQEGPDGPVKTPKSQTRDESTARARICVGTRVERPDDPCMRAARSRLCARRRETFAV